MNIVPKDMYDLQAVFHLNNANDTCITPYIPQLLECLQDMNWPVAMPICERLSTLGNALIMPIASVLQGKDEMWKYWVVSLLLYSVDEGVLKGLSFTLHSIKSNPTKYEREHCVHGAVCCLLIDRNVHPPLFKGDLCH